MALSVFEPRAWTLGLGTDSLKNLHYFGTREILTSAYPVRPFRTAADLVSHMRDVRDAETLRLKTLGFEARAILGVSPVMRPERAHFELWELLAQEVKRGDVAAIGELSLLEENQTSLEALDAQLLIARAQELPVVLVAPSVRPVARTYAMVERALACGIRSDRILVHQAPVDVMGTMLEEGVRVSVTLGPLGMEPREVPGLWNGLRSLTASCVRHSVMLTSAARAGLVDVLAMTKALHFLSLDGVDAGVLDDLSRKNAQAFFAHRNS